ncbi:RNA polymerase III subunit C82 [Agyrium rufum]|nr:RNA polymerase III subunit C82 [Agyrium rufum]
MSRRAIELCLLQVDDLYGDLISRVFEVLLQHGRLTYPALLNHSGLLPKQLKTGLAVLIQHHLVQWYIPDGQPSASYEADWEAAYDLVRSGKLLSTVRDRLGSTAEKIFSSVLLQEYTRVDEILKAYGEKSQSSPSTHKTAGKNNVKPHSVNGEHNSSQSEPQHSKIALKLQELIDAAFLMVVHPSHFRPKADNITEAENELTGPTGLFPTKLKAVEKLTFDSNLRDKLKEWRYDAQNLSGFGNTKKRTNGVMGFDGPPGKKRKVNGMGISVIDEEPLSRISSQAILRVNAEKLPVTLRNKMLVRLVQHRIGRPCAQLYGAVLDEASRDLPCCHPNLGLSALIDADDEEVLLNQSTHQIAGKTKDKIDLSASLGDTATNHTSVDPMIHPKKRRRRLSSDEESIDNIAIHEDDDDRINGDDDYLDRPPQRTSQIATHENLVQQNLLLLSEHPYRFLTHHSGTASVPETWTIKYHPLVSRLRLIELENIVLNRYGAPGLRIIRILLEKGKLDEKALGAMSLLNQKILRSILTTMNEAGHLELQEIPRDNNRQPSRTMFLWFFDPERCRLKVLEETYQAMARCLQRRRVEKEKVQVVVDKSLRTDVVGREDELLSRDEREVLGRWRAMEEILLGEVARLDDLVAVLRDF